MKRMKKIMVTLLAAMMTMAMTITAFAAEGATPAAAGTNTLTVNVKSTTPAQDLNGQTINLYKLFDVTESGTTGSKNYAYTVNTETGYKDALVSVLGSPITAASTDEQFAAAVSAIGSNNSIEVQNFANKFTTYALTNSLAATATSEKITESKTTYEFTGLNAGYYLVYVTGGKEIQSSLVTVDETTNTVNLKTEAPSIEKTANKTTVNIGDVVTYTVNGSIPDTTGYEEYVYKIHDTLSTGLDFVKNANGDALDNANEVNVTIAFEDTGVAAGTAPTTATLSGEGNRTMALDLSAWVRANQANKGKEFTVTYYAKVNKDAVVTEKNKAQLEYGNKPDETTTTTPSEAKTPTYPLDILKIKKGSTPEEILAGAHFTLYASTTEGAIDENKPIKVTKEADGKYSYAANQASTDSSVITDMVTVANKIDGQGYNLHINGLAAGIYYLKETQAPEGYNKLTDAIKVTITKSTTEDENAWTLTVDKGTVDGKIVKVENSTGSLLPSTGGRGAIAFAVIAALLVFGVAVSFIRDKRKGA